MGWLLKKGQDLSSESQSHACVDLTLAFWPNSPRRASLDLKATDVEKAPSRVKDKVCCEP
jgi:hypothetical protein